MVSQISLDCDLCLGPENIGNIGPENVGNKDGDSSVPSSSQEQTAPQMPVKKQTRQWAAWTRQEEESFFAALRQVGKNFEKITSRVQSKNKDQVRHYYYRLVRRMNKLLGPDLCLDAKNSKDTNAAMLRWWSLLEKYSCKASKLHLKPRRFKIFVETLENQLMKDRRKNIKKRLSTGENNTSMPNIPISNLVRASGPDNRSVKMVLVDSQNIPKVGTGKGALFRRHVNIGTNRTNCKVDPASVKTVKSRRKTGLASTAAYKRWEKAAIAGVSLVADAAEHLERVDTDKENVQEPPGSDGSHLVENATHSLQICSQSMFNQNNNSTKLKLQLFPIDECARKALEMDHHNPYLELTLSTRKKISSVLEHLNHKWRNSTFLSEELMLFPYWAQKENLIGYQKWTKDSPLCAADVYYLIGSPPVFRLRYGWFSKSDVESATARVLSFTNIAEHNSTINIARGHSTETENQREPHNYHRVTEEPIVIPTPSSASTPIKTVACSGSALDVNTSFHDNTICVQSPGKDAGNLTVTRKVENTHVALVAGEWADSLTNISMGDLLSESTPNIDADCTEFPMPSGSNCLQQIPFSCDSFDAAIAAHISKHQNKPEFHHSPASHGPSIWDAEETCDAFSFRKTSAFCDTNHNTTVSNSIEDCEQDSVPGPSALFSKTEESPELDRLTNSSPRDPAEWTGCRFDHPPANASKDFSTLSDIYWPDSLGPLDLDITPCRYQSNDLILSDSLSGLNRLLANSLDAFQNCSFFGPDKKDPPPSSSSTGESYQTSFSDFKI